MPTVAPCPAAEPRPDGPAAALRPQGRSSRSAIVPLGLALLSVGCGQSPETEELRPTPHPTNPLSVLPRGVHLVSAIAPARQTLLVENRSAASVLVQWRPEGLDDCGAETPGFCLPDPSRGVRLAPGATAPVAVEFTPGEAPFEVRAALHFTCDAPVCAQTVPLFAEALPARASWRISPFRGAFRDTLVDESDVAMLLIENLGTTAVRIEEIGITYDSDHAITLDDPPPTPLTLAPGEAQPLQASFRPTRLGHAWARLRAMDADGNGQLASLSGNGTGGCTLDVTSTGFGGIFPNEPWVHRIGVRNLGDAPCPVDFTLTSSAVGLTSTLIGPPSAVIEPGEAEVVTIEVLATCPGSFEASLEISGRGFTMDVPVGIRVPWGSVLVRPNGGELRGLVVGCPVSRTFSLSNTGHGPLQLNRVEVSPGALDPLDLPAVVAPGHLPLRFTATFVPHAPAFEAQVELDLLQRTPFDCPELPPVWIRLEFTGDAATAGPCE